MRGKGKDGETYCEDVLMVGWIERWELKSIFPFTGSWNPYSFPPTPFYLFLFHSSRMNAQKSFKSFNLSSLLSVHLSLR